MDINSLLSPRESPAAAGQNGHSVPPGFPAPNGIQAHQPHHHPLRSNSSQAVSRKQQQHHRSRNGKHPLQRAITSPENHHRKITPQLPPNAVAQAQTIPPSSLTSASSVGSGRSAHNALSTPTGGYGSPLGPSKVSTSPSHPIHRQINEKMDFLADLASIQQTHPPPSSAPNPRNIRTSISHDVLRSPSMTHIPTSQRSGSIVPQTTEVVPAPALTHDRMNTTSLSKEDLQSIADLTKRLEENNYLYDVHIQLIGLLHEGLISHVTSEATGDTHHDPNDYLLLRELRQAREAMDTRIPVGEERWIQWVQDECMLARTNEDRLRVAELCSRAAQEEVGSPKLWRLYGDWMWYLYKTTHGVTRRYEENTLEQHAVVGKVLANRQWSSEDLSFGQEHFAWNNMLDTWINGVKATEWHMNDSHLVWDPYVKILLHDLSQNPSTDKIKHVWTFYAERLQKPHATWQDTFQGFSEFVSSNYAESIYEETMVNATTQSAKSRHEYELRQEFELRLQRAADSADQNLEGMIMTEYLEWEVEQIRRKNASPFSFKLYQALLERANLRFPTTSEWWEDHIDYMTEQPDANSDLLHLMFRASRHCPWSGNLWLKHLYALESANRPFEELEDVKHRATSTGLLEEIGGMDELIKVFTAWCGYLRRRAFGVTAGEDDRDVAEMGIRSAIENVKDIGARKYGKDFKGDPLFRAEKVYLKFLTQAGRLGDARETWNKLTTTHGDLYDFWDHYYLWEMTLWDRESATSGAPPTKATGVLRQAMRRPNLDYPEKIIEMYLHHCAQHEPVQKLQSAHSESRRAMKQVNKRREKEMSEDAAASAAPMSQEQTNAVDEIMGEGDMQYTGKRKRESDIAEAQDVKRAKSEDHDETQPRYGDASSSATSQLKRDRENSTVIVKNLPTEVTETRVRQFFRDCGNILALTLIKNDTSDSGSAIVEFESSEDVLTAKTKDMKMIEGRSVEVQVGTGTTLWVTNYPPEADETYIRDLFKEFGEIVGVRFPSLKYNTHRRFCYVQFLTPTQAYSATSIDGKKLGDQLVLTAKISDPSIKQDRKGATNEGREIFVGHLHWKATEDDVETLFGQFGTVAAVRIPRNMKNQSKGHAFVDFGTSADAEAALYMNQKEYRGLDLKVELTVPHKTAKMFAKNTLRSASPMDVDQAGSPASTNSHPPSSEVISHAERHARTLLLRNIPDTVNDTRIRRLMEQYGELKKVSTNPLKGEAIVEFADMKDVGKAELAIDGYEIETGAKVEIGRTEGPGRKIQNGNQNSAAKGVWGLGNKKMQSGVGPVKRPAQSTGRRGGKGGLGFVKNRHESAVPATVNNEKDEISNGTETNHASSGTDVAKSTGKSNADFQAMLGTKE